MNDRGPWIRTVTGKRFHLLDPRPEEIDIMLSRAPRWPIGEGWIRPPRSLQSSPGIFDC